MLPVVDYGGIAIVVPMVTAVGSIIDNDGKFGFEVYLSGMNEPFVIGFEKLEEAEESREELISIITQFHYARELGPEFDLEEIDDDYEDEDVEEEEDEEDEKDRH